MPFSPPLSTERDALKRSGASDPPDPELGAGGKVSGSGIFRPPSAGSTPEDLRRRPDGGLGSIRRRCASDLPEKLAGSARSPLRVTSSGISERSKGLPAHREAVGVSLGSGSCDGRSFSTSGRWRCCETVCTLRTPRIFPVVTAARAAACMSARGSERQRSEDRGQKAGRIYKTGNGRRLCRASKGSGRADQELRFGSSGRRARGRVRGSDRCRLPRSRGSAAPAAASFSSA